MGNAGLAARMAPLTHCLALCSDRRSVCPVGLLGRREAYRLELRFLSRLCCVVGSTLLRSDHVRDCAWGQENEEDCARD